jgi:uncharacterized OB-fold protein
MKLPAPAPSISPETKPFWDATARGELLIPACNRCDRCYWYPRTLCPFCGSLDTRWQPATGTATVYSYTIVRRDVSEYAEATPYVLAYVELDEGPRMIANLVDCDIDAVRIGDRVQAVFQPTDVDAALVRFAPLLGGPEREEAS